MRQILFIFAIVVQVFVHHAVAQDGVRWIQSTNRTDSALIQQVNHMLDQRSPVRGSDKSMALSKLMTLYPVTFVLDEHALQEENISPDEPIFVPSVPGISIRNQLKLLLGPLELTYLEEPGYLVITTKKSAANVVRLYDVTDLVSIGKGKFNTLTLTGIIEDTINPADWQNNGGTSNIIQWTNGKVAVFFIAAPDETHEAIRDLFSSHRELIRLATASRSHRHDRSTQVKTSIARRSKQR